MGISFNPNSLRKIGLRRILVVFGLVPLFVIHVLITRLFLWLDDICFPAYKNVKVNRPVFIAGFPRSGTTFLMNTLVKNEAFTCFKLWEMVLAPSIIQKKAIKHLSSILNILHIDLTSILQKLDNLLFNRLKGIHDMSLMDNEEDEILFAYCFSTVYFIFLFPELHHLHNLLDSENTNNLSKRITNMEFYHSLVQRHLYCKANSSLRFLSKNPFHPLRIQSIHQTFPTALCIIPTRNVEQRIPSSISLCERLYSYFSSIDTKGKLRTNTIQFLNQWQKNLDEYLSITKENYLVISFNEMVANPESIIKQVLQAIKIPATIQYVQFLKEQTKYSKSYKSQHHYTKPKYP